MVAAGQKWRCNRCRRRLTHTFEMDHIRALSHGGGNSTANFQALCPDCHRHKSLVERYCGACGCPLKSCRCRDGPVPPALDRLVKPESSESSEPDEPDPPDPPAPAESAPGEPDEPLSAEALAVAFEWAAYGGRPCPRCGADRCRRC